MNERIRELAEQAQKAVDARWEKEGYPPYPEAHRIFIEERDIKLAELIIRKCVAICQDIDGEDSQDGRCARQDCAVEIQEHFGVES